MTGWIHTSLTLKPFLVSSKKVEIILFFVFMICIFYELFKIESKAWAQIPAFSHPIGQRTESKVCQFLDTWGETNSFLLLIIFLFNFH